MRYDIIDFSRCEGRNFSTVTQIKTYVIGWLSESDVAMALTRHLKRVIRNPNMFKLFYCQNTKGASFPRADTLLELSTVLRHTHYDVCSCSPFRPAPLIRCTSSRASVSSTYEQDYRARGRQGKLIQIAQN